MTIPVPIAVLQLAVTVNTIPEDQPMPTMQEVVPVEFDYFWIVFLYTGEAPPVQTSEDAEQQRIEHLLFLRDLARERVVVAAGPFDQRPDEALRGIMLIRGDLSREEVESRISKDPHVRAGSMKYELAHWFTAKGSLSWPAESPW